MYTFFQYGQQTLRVTEDVDDLDIAKYVLGGKLNLKVVVDPGVLLGSTDTVNGAIFSSVNVRPEVSSLSILCNGTIQGCNGTGGYGIPPVAGGNGAPAINVDSPITIDTTGGYIKGGGGGGGSIYSLNGFNYVLAGGGGFPGGTGVPAAFVGASSQYGEALGKDIYWSGVYTGRAGHCLGPGLDGVKGEPDPAYTALYPPQYIGDAGLAGAAVNAYGNTVTILGGAANITGAII